MNLNCGCALKYSVLVYSGLCWVLNKICRFKCGNNNKSETALKKQRIRPRFIPEPKQKANFWPRVQPKPRPKRVSNLEKKKAHMASGAPKTEAKRVSNLKKEKRSSYGLGWHRKPRPKGGLYGLGFV